MAVSENIIIITTTIIIIKKNSAVRPPLWGRGWGWEEWKNMWQTLENQKNNNGGLLCKSLRDCSVLCYCLLTGFPRAACGGNHQTTLLWNFQPQALFESGNSVHLCYSSCPNSSPKTAKAYSASRVGTQKPRHPHLLPRKARRKQILPFL